MILFAASWAAPTGVVARTSAVLATVAKMFPTLESTSVQQTAWTGPVNVGWVCNPTTGFSVAASGDRVCIIEGIGLRVEGGVAVADDIGVFDDLDGQFVALDAAPDSLSCWNDPLGLRPLYFARAGDGWVLANRVEILAKLIGDRSVDLEGASMFAAIGWVTGDRTLAPSVMTMPAGQRWAWRPGHTPSIGAARSPVGMVQRRKHLHFDVAKLAESLVSQCVTVARWAGDVDAPLTAGLDSRLIMAVLRAGGVEATYYTTGDEASTDVLAARELARVTGVPHVVRPWPEEAVVGEWQAVAGSAVGQNDGMVNLWQVVDTIASGRTPHLIFWGIGGEIARASYMHPEYFVPRARGALIARFATDRTRNRGGLITLGAVHAARAAIRRFADDAIAWGLDPIDVPDAFYTIERVGRWAGANARKVLGSSLYAPLATKGFLTIAFGLPAIARYSEPLHWNLIRYLAPDLHAFPLAKGWRMQLPYANLAQAAARRLHRRGPAPEVPDRRFTWLEAMRRDLATQCLDRAASPLWEVVDRQAFASIMLDSAAIPARRAAAETLYGIITLFEYERLRSASS